MLVSVKDGRSVYIGTTRNMEQRLKSHNSGFGAIESTDPKKRPWGLLAYVIGFDTKKDARHFEKCWQSAIISKKRIPDPMEAALEGSRVLKRNLGYDNARIIVAGGVPYCYNIYVA